MKPQDVVLLLKIVSMDTSNWNQKPVSEELCVSQSEISESVARLKFAGLLAPDGKSVMKMSLMEFLEHGIKYVFPEKPGAVVRGMPTSHSAYPLKDELSSTEDYVWPHAKGTVRGHAISPLYKSVPDAAKKDASLYGLLTLVDALRVGRVREKQLACMYLKRRLRLEE